MHTADFFYDLPDEAIAQTPLEPRDAARLLDTRDMTDRVFSDLPSMLLPGDLVVVNHTKVRAARLRGTKVATGGAVEILLLGHRPDGMWDALIRPARRVRSGMTLRLEGDLTTQVVADPIEGRCVIDFGAISPPELESHFEAVGEIPLPPYIRTPLQDRGRYQTVFADAIGSAAAPTAGLHFTPQVLDSLTRRDIAVTSVELRVGLDTFRPITSEKIGDHRMHSEFYSVPAAAGEAIKAARIRGGRVIAVGTTVVRTLESSATGEGLVEPGRGSTQLFIRPGYRFEVVDAMVTNFHVPGSTLIVLIASVLGDRWREVYDAALARGYRFLSFGDAMFAEVVRQ